MGISACQSKSFRGAASSAMLIAVIVFQMVPMQDIGAASDVYGFAFAAVPRQPPVVGSSPHEALSKSCSRTTPHYIPLSIVAYK